MGRYVWVSTDPETQSIIHRKSGASDKILGAIISSYCSEFEDLDGKGHGVKLETTNMTVCAC